jgi:O-antigen ligase
VPSSNSKTDALVRSPQPSTLPIVPVDSLLGRVVAGLVVLGLGLGLIVPKVAGGAFLLLSAIAIVWLEPAVTRRRSAALTLPGDRQLFLAVAGFVGLWLAAWAGSGLNEAGADDVGRILRLLLIVPLYLFLRRVQGLESALWWGASFGAVLAAVHAVNLTIDPSANPWDGRVGAATNPIYFGGIALIFALILLPRAASPETGPVERVVTTLGLLAGLLAATLSGSRGAWIAVPILLLIYSLIFARGHRPLRRYGWPLALIVIAGLLSLIPGVPLGDRLLDAIESLKATGVELDPWDTLAVRWELWSVAGGVIADHPWIGAGPGAFQAAMQVATSEGLHPELLRYEHPHNQYLSALIINGPIGLIALLALFGVPLLLSRRDLSSSQRNRRSMAWSTFVVVGVLAVVAIGESIFQRNVGIVWFALLTSLTLALTRSAAPPVDDRDPV